MKKLLPKYQLGKLIRFVTNRYNKSLVNYGRQKLINWRTSKFYKQRLKENNLEDFGKHNLEVITNTPINYNHTLDELKVKGVTTFKNPEIYFQDGSFNIKWSPTIDMTTDTKYTRQIPTHELIHTETGPLRNSELTIVGTQDGLPIYNGRPEQRMILEQNERLLPQKINNTNSYPSITTETRAFLQTDFIHNILPHLKDPNNEDEILQYLNKKNINDIFTPESIEAIQNRNMSNQDIAKYLANALSLIPIVYATSNQ